jgi:hypothetical protein
LFPNIKTVESLSSAKFRSFFLLFKECKSTSLLCKKLFDVDDSFCYVKKSDLFSLLKRQNRNEKNSKDKNEGRKERKKVLPLSIVVALTAPMYKRGTLKRHRDNLIKVLLFNKYNKKVLNY